MPSIPAGSVVRADHQRGVPSEISGGVSINCGQGGSNHTQLPNEIHTTASAAPASAPHPHTTNNLLAGIATSSLAGSGVPTVPQANAGLNASSTGAPRGSCASTSSYSSGSDIPFAPRANSSASQAAGDSSAEKLEASGSTGKSSHSVDNSVAATATAPTPPAVVIGATNKNQIETPANRSTASSPPSHQRVLSDSPQSTTPPATAPPATAGSRARTATPRGSLAVNNRVTASSLLSQFTRRGPAKRSQAATPGRNSSDEDNVVAPGPKRRRAGNKDSA